MAQLFSTEQYLKFLHDIKRGVLPPDPANRIEQLLSINGDGTGTTNMVERIGSYYIAPPPGEVYFITRINTYLEDGINERFSAALYGATAALDPGLVLAVENAGGAIAILTPKPITKIGHWDLIAGIDMRFTEFPSGSSDFCAVRTSFFKGGGNIRLIGDNEEKLVLHVQDPLGAGGAALVEHYCQVQGGRFRQEK